MNHPLRGLGPVLSHQGVEIETVEQLHDVVEPAVFSGAEVVELYRVGRLERGSGPGLALEAPEQQLAVARHLGTDELDRRRPDQEPVACPPDLAHSAAADLLFENVLAQFVGFGDLLPQSVGDP